MRASKSKDIVEIQRARGVHDLQPMCGYVVDASPVFALVQPIQDRLDLDGYDVIRQSDIERVRPVPAAKAAFYREVLAWRGQRRKRPLGIDLTSMQTVLESVPRRYARIAVHYERKDPRRPSRASIGAIASPTSRACSSAMITRKPSPPSTPGAARRALRT
jgi:hypothetical protein